MLPTAFHLPRTRVKFSRLRLFVLTVLFTTIFVAMNSTKVVVNLFMPWVRAGGQYSGQKIRHLPIKTQSYSVLRVPTTQLAKMSIDLKFVKLTADVLEN